jgi:hypothetical protein
MDFFHLFMQINKEKIIRSGFTNLGMKDAPKVGCSQGMYENLENLQNQKPKGTSCLKLTPGTPEPVPLKEENKECTPESVGKVSWSQFSPSCIDNIYRSLTAGYAVALCETRNCIEP